MKKYLYKYKHILFCFAISFIFLTIFSKNSFLYYINDWWDANAFFTVGKSMVRGIVPYKDLFEQKGPLLYLIYGISSLISYDSFIGVYLIEIISFTVFLYYAKKIINIFYNDTYSYLGIIILTFSIFTLKPFGHGGSAEEFALPMLMISIYYLFKYINDKHLTKVNILTCGVMAGLVFFIKYSLIGFWIIFPLIFIKDTLKQNNIKNGIKNILIFIFGMFISYIPWLIYFISTGSLQNFINVYLLVNIKLYAKPIPLIIKFLIAIILLIKNIIIHSSYLSMIVIPIVIYITTNNKKIKEYTPIIISLLIGGVLIYIGGTSYFYYSLILVPFNIIGVLLIINFLHKRKIKLMKYSHSILIILTISLTLIISDNTSYILKNKNYYAQYKFSKIINNNPNKSILNYSFLDGGFYLTTKQIPKYYFFMKNNIPYENFPEMLDSQNKYIIDNEPEFIISKSNKKIIKNNNYKLIKSHKQKYEDREITYYLYQKN